MLTVAVLSVPRTAPAGLANETLKFSVPSGAASSLIGTAIVWAATVGPNVSVPLVDA